MSWLLCKLQSTQTQTSQAVLSLQVDCHGYTKFILHLPSLNANVLNYKPIHFVNNYDQPLISHSIRSVLQNYITMNS